jgi:hypothetical protein
MNKKIIFSTLIFSLGLIFSSVPRVVSAEAVQTAAEVSVEVAVDPTTSGEASISDESSGWKLFFLGVRERLSLLTTFDPVKKAEKALQFAEERTEIAERLANKTDDPQAQERINNILERAAKLEEQADKVKDKLLENPDARAQLLLKNLLNFKERKEEVFLKLEEKLTPEQLERLQNVRTQAEEKSRSLMNALENSNIPEEVRAHLENVKARIEEHQEEVKEFRDEQKELLDRIKSGDESAKEELQTIREERAAEIKLNVEERQENRAEVKNKLEEKADSTPAAERKLERIRQEEMLKKQQMLERQREKSATSTGERQKPVRPLLPLQERPQN